jgi:hypothetical protein
VLPASTPSGIVTGVVNGIVDFTPFRGSFNAKGCPMYVVGYAAAQMSLHARAKSFWNFAGSIMRAIF